MHPTTKRRFLILGIIGTILVVPLIAMQFTEEVNWNIADFLVAGILLLILGSIIELIIQKVQHHKYKQIFFIVAILLFLLLWAELAVGIFDSPLAGS